MGNLLPDLYLCVICESLHRIDCADFPANETRLINKSKRPCAVPEWSNGSYSVGYISIPVRHVNLTTKYTRMNTSHQDYYKALLRKCEVDHGHTPYKFIAEPRVVRDRYIIMTSCIFSPGSKPRCSATPYCFESLCEIPFRFCPHSVLVSSTDPADYCYPFATALRQAFDSLSDEQEPRIRFFSCDQCATDISFLVKKDETYIVSWAELGTGESSEDPFWQTHLARRPYGPKFEYNHGSVREMYTSYIT